VTDGRRLNRADRGALEAIAASVEESTQEPEALSVLRAMLEDARRLLEPCMRALETGRLLDAARHLDASSLDVSGLGLGDFVEALAHRLSREAGNAEQSALVRGWAMRAKGYARFADGDFAGARRRFRRALSWATEADEPTLWGASLLSIGAVFYQQGNAARARRAYEQALPHARRSDEPWLLAYVSTNLGSLILADEAERADGLFAESLRAREAMRTDNDAPEAVLSPAYVNWGVLRAKQGRYSKAEELLRKALSASGDRDPQGRALASQNLGNVLTEQRRYAEAVAAYEIALDLAQRHGHRGKEGELRRALAVCLDKAGEFRRAYEQFSEVADAPDRYRLSNFDAAMAVHDAGVMALRLESREEGADRFRCARSLFAALGDKKWEATCLLDEAAAYDTLGREEQREALLREALNVVRGTRHHEVKLTAYGRLAHLLFERALVDDALAVFNKERALLRRLGRSDQLARRSAEVGAALAGLDQHHDALKMRREAARLYEAQDEVDWSIRTRNDLANSLVELGRIEEAERFYRGNLERAAALENRALQAEALLNLGELMRRRDDTEGAARTLGRAVEISRQLNDLSGVALGLNNLGLTLERDGDQEGAMQAFEESLEAASLARDEEAVASALSSMGSVAFARAAFSEARDLFARAVEHASRSGRQSLEAGMKLNLASTVYELEGASQAESHAEEAAELAQEVLHFEISHRAAAAVAGWFARDHYPQRAGDWAGYALLFGPLLSGRLDQFADQIAEPLALLDAQERRRFFAAMLNRCRLLERGGEFGGALIEEARAIRSEIL
jgi:tetratricopeptide (TPR) repeat protein